MIESIAGFQRTWSEQSATTSKVLHALTDASLAQEVAPGFRTIGRLAWHLTQTIPEMLHRAGLSVAGPDEHEPVPARANAIAEAYDLASGSVLHAVSGWSDATLAQEDEMYGERWTRGRTLTVLITHECHHRGQLTVLMRQAGLRVPEISGPTREDWAQWGMPVPAV